MFSHKKISSKLNKKPINLLSIPFYDHNFIKKLDRPLNNKFDSKRSLHENFGNKTLQVSRTKELSHSRESSKNKKNRPKESLEASNLDSNKSCGFIVLISRQKIPREPQSVKIRQTSRRKSLSHPGASLQSQPVMSWPRRQSIFGFMIKRRRQATSSIKLAFTFFFAAAKIFLALSIFELRVSPHYRVARRSAIKIISANFTHKQHSSRMKR
jgi:hypothetical protein